MNDPRSHMKMVDEDGCVECPAYQKKVSAAENCAGCPYNNQETELAELVRRRFSSLSGIAFECRFMDGNPEPSMKKVDVSYHKELIMQPLAEPQKVAVKLVATQDLLKGITLDYVVKEPVRGGL
jgi:hypothetical protein